MNSPIFQLKRFRSIYIALMLSFFPAWIATAKAPADKNAIPASNSVDVKRVVADAERIRSVEPAEVNVRLVTETSANGAPQTTAYEMEIQRGVGKKAYVRFTSPSEEIGRQMLVVGDQYWARFPDSEKVHKISRKEMIGNSVFQLVDLFQMDVENDYSAKLDGEEVINSLPCHRVQLNAKNDEAPYSRIEYFIAKQDHFPIRAKFYSGSGKHLKTLDTLGRKKFSGVERPATFVMTDEVTAGRQSKWTTNTIKQKQIAESLFSKDYLLAH